MGTNSFFLTIRYEAFINKRLTFFTVGAGAGFESEGNMSLSKKMAFIFHY